MTPQLPATPALAARVHASASPFPKVRWRAEDGSAPLEFVTVGLLLLVPLVYLVLTLSALQGAALAAEGVARHGARVFVQARSTQEATSRLERAVAVGLADYGISPQAATITVSCFPDPGDCLARQGRVAVTVRIAVPLPLLPAAISPTTGAEVPVQARAVQTVSTFRPNP